MAITCWPCVLLICLMRRAMASATRPLTPVSISSKMMVGSAARMPMSAFSANITRAISPPLAASAMGRGGMFLLAENRKVTLSAPLSVRSAVVSICTANLLSGISNWVRLVAMCFSTSRAAFCLCLVSMLARRVASACRVFACCSSWLTRSSPWVISSSFFCSSMASSSSSSLLRTACFCSNV